MLGKKKSKKTDKETLDFFTGENYGTAKTKEFMSIKDLDKLKEEGWELLTCSHEYGKGWFYYFKKIIQTAQVVNEPVETFKKTVTVAGESYEIPYKTHEEFQEKLNDLISKTVVIEEDEVTK